MYSVDKARNGQKTLFFNETPIHSRIDPSKEGIIFNKENKEILENKQDKIFVFIGNFGLGYLLSDFKPPSLSIIKIFVVSFGEEENVFLNHGLKELKNKFQIHFFNPLLKKDLSLLKEALTKVPVKNIVVKAPLNILKILGENFSKALNVVDTAIKHHLFNLLTDSAFGKRWWHNFIINYSQKDIVFIKKIEPSLKPILLIGSGYSTYENIKLIKKIAPHFLIMTILPALELLIHYQVTPNLIFVSDGGEANRYYTTIQKISQSTSLATCVYPHTLPVILRWFQSRTLFFNSGLEMESILTPELPLIPSAGSVASSMILLATQMTKNIVYTGFDFSYLHNHPHFPGSALETQSVMTSNRLSPVEKMMAMRVHQENIPYIGKNKTSVAMQSYAQDFNMKVEEFKKKGAHIEILSDTYLYDLTNEPLTIKDVFSQYSVIPKELKFERLKILQNELARILEIKDFYNPLVKAILSKGLLKGQKVDTLLKQEIRLIDRYFNQG